MQTSELPFSVLRRLLLDLDFSERVGPRSAIVFEHAPSDTMFVFRHYALDEKVNWPDYLSVRKQLDERGLLAQASFDQALQKTPA
jgi:hypothetical protein